jgi:hypothetical protein
MREGNHLEDLAFDGRLIVKLAFFKKKLEYVNWFDLVKGRNK